MGADRLERLLRRVHAAPAGRPSPASSGAGEERIVRLYAERRIPKEKAIMKIARRSLVAAVVVAALVLAARSAPAEVAVAVGRRLIVAVAAGGSMPQPDAVVGVVHTLIGPEEHGRQIGVEMRGTDDGAARLQIDVWGVALPAGTLTDKVRASFPDLAAASISEEELKGTAHVTLADKIEHALFDQALDPEALERARQELIARIRAQEGPNAQVDVQVENGTPGHRKIRVEVRKEEHEGQQP